MNIKHIKILLKEDELPVLERAIKDKIAEMKFNAIDMMQGFSFDDRTGEYYKSKNDYNALINLSKKISKLSLTK